MSDARPSRAPAPSAWRGYARWTLRGAAGAFALVVGAWCWDAVAHAEALRLRALLVSGPFERVTPAELYARVRPHLDAGFLGLDLAAVRADLEALPWVAEANVRREWPGTLRVSVREQVPVATWQGVALLNAAGRRFAEDGARFAGKLPALAGPDGSERYVLETFGAMQRELIGGPLNLARAELSERRAWEVWLVDGTHVRLGRRDALPRLARFAQLAAPLVEPQAQHVAYVDMRYANGFAVGWRGPRPQQAAPRRREKTDV